MVQLADKVRVKKIIKLTTGQGDLVVFRDMLHQGVGSQNYERTILSQFVQYGPSGPA